MMRVALVIGPSKEISGAICKRLARLGYEPIAVSVDERQGESLSLDADTSSQERRDENSHRALRLAIEKIESETGRIDVCISHAAIPFSLMEEMATRMSQGGWGRIVEIAFTEGDAVATDSNSNVGRHSRQEQVKALASQLPLRGVTINTIVTDDGDSSGSAADSHADDRRASPPVSDRLSKAEEIAGLAAYLVSDEAGILSGARIAFNAGRRLV
jgi:acetoacetyl-CoA reductase